MAAKTSRQAMHLVLPDFTPDNRLSLNGRRRTHWTIVRTLQNAAKWHIVEALGTWQQQAPETEVADWLWQDGGYRFPQIQAQVTIEFVFPTQRRRDPDGLAGLAKPLLDALVSRGVLLDDDAEHVSLTVTATVSKGVHETRIMIEV